MKIIVPIQGKTEPMYYVKNEMASVVMSCTDGVLVVVVIKVNF